MTPSQSPALVCVKVLVSNYFFPARTCLIIDTILKDLMNKLNVTSASQVTMVLIVFPALIAAKVFAVTLLLVLVHAFVTLDGKVCNMKLHIFFFHSYL